MRLTWPLREGGSMKIRHGLLGMVLAMWLAAPALAAVKEAALQVKGMVCAS